MNGHDSKLSPKQRQAMRDDDGDDTTKSFRYNFQPSNSGLEMTNMKPDTSPRVSETSTRIQIRLKRAA
jgi:hypothetical protein